MGDKELIFKLYFEEHLKQKDIAKKIQKSTQYVSEVLKQNPKTKEEKEKRHKESIEKKKAYNKEYFKKYKRNKKDEENREEYQKLIATINKDNEKLSTKTEMSDLDFVKWNRSAYENDTKTSSGLKLKKAINATVDLPKKINNIVNAGSIRGTKVYGIRA